ncbi:MAG: hypothetical protein ACRDD3_00615 [Azovibrio sp.]
MEFIGTIFFFVGLLSIIYGLIGLLDPSWIKRANLNSTPSRIDCAIFASLAPLPFMFVGDLFYGAHEPADMFGFMMGLILSIGSISFYVWGVVGVKNYLERGKNFSPVVGILAGCVLAVIPVFGFMLLILAVGVLNAPEFSLIQQLVMLFVGLFILIAFVKIFKAPILGVFISSSPETPVMGRPNDVEERKEPPAAEPHSTITESWLFSFTYTEDDGLPIRMDARISAAQADNQGRRYIQGVCTKTSTPRFFWLGRILGPMTGPVVEGSNGEQWDASVVFERLQALQQPQTDPLGNR